MIVLAILHGDTLKNQSKLYGVSPQRVSQLFRYGRELLVDGLSYYERHDYGFSIPEMRKCRYYWFCKIYDYVGQLRKI